MITEKPPKLTKKADAPDTLTATTPTQEPNLLFATLLKWLPLKPIKIAARQLK
jgi:hypothetical protein